MSSVSSSPHVFQFPSPFSRPVSPILSSQQHYSRRPVSPASFVGSHASGISHPPGSRKRRRISILNGVPGDVLFNRVGDWDDGRGLAPSLREPTPPLMRTISSSAVPTPEGEGDGRNFWGLVDLSSGFSAQAEKRKANRDASRRFRNRQHEELLRYRKRRVIDLEERLTAQQDEIQGHVETIRRQSEKIRSLVQQRDNYRAELDLYHDRFGSLSKLPPRSPSLYSLPSCLLPMAEKNVAVSSTKPADESPKQLGHTGPISGRSHCFLFSQLPTRSRKSEAFIPINKDGERLDPWYQWYDPPSLDAFSEYHGRVMVDKLCNSWHLSGECGDTSCEYDHSDASDTIIDVLRYTLLRDPCPKARECRSSKCYFGHICQKPYCKAAESRQCRFNYRAHTMDLQVHQWVAPVENPDAQHELISGFSLGSTPGTDQTAAKIEKPQNTI